MKGYELDGKRTANGYTLTGSVWASPRAEGGWHVTPKAGETLLVVAPGGKKTRVKSSTPVILWIEDNHLYTKQQPPVPALTKEQGMALAYDRETPEREWFESLLYEFCTTVDRSVVFSSNDIWHLWRSKGWPDPPKRAFVGPTMQHGEKAGWMVFDRMVANTMKHSHSGEQNRGYRSLIGSDPVPEQDPLW
jgi:hypothetical protein